MWKYGLLFLSLAGAVFGLVLSMRSTKEPPPPALLKEPVRSPFKHAIAGAGLIEPESESVVIGVNEPGRVVKVFVKEGSNVAAGDPLFKTDTLSLEGERLTLEAAVTSAEAELKRIEAYRRKEEEPLLLGKVAEAKSAQDEARVTLESAQLAIVEAKSVWDDQLAKLKRLDPLVAARASSEEERERVQYQRDLAKARFDSAQSKVREAESKIQTTQARLDQAQADLKMYQAGPWPVDVDKARTAVAAAKAALERNAMEIGRRTVKSPIKGMVLRCNLREGEYHTAMMTNAEGGAIVVGNLESINVRVDIDEFDAQRFKAGMKAAAFLKTGGSKPISLEFVRVDPFVMPKRALTNSQHELVDTRVLQVIFKIVSPERLYVGQQVDVYVDEDSVGGGAVESKVSEAGK